MNRTRRQILSAAGALALGLPRTGIAQAWKPARDVRIMNGFAAGGSGELVCRVIAEAVRPLFGQNVIVDTQAGANGFIAAQAVARAAPDGQTVGMATMSMLTISPQLPGVKLPINVETDLTPIANIAGIYILLVVSPEAPFRTVPELIAYAKANPGKVNFGSAGSGTITHLGGELLKVEAGVNLIHVPYKGAAPAVNDMLGGQVQMGIFDVPVVLSHIKAGKLKALAITSAKRAPSLPDVPTTGEMGFPKVISDNWYGLVGPAGIPPSIAKRIHAAAIAALNSRELVTNYEKISGSPMPSSPEEYAVFIAAEQQKWGKVVKAIGFKAQ